MFWLSRKLKWLITWEMGVYVTHVLVCPFLHVPNCSVFLKHLYASTHICTQFSTSHHRPLRYSALNGESRRHWKLVFYCGNICLVTFSLHWRTNLIYLYISQGLVNPPMDRTVTGLWVIPATPGPQQHWIQFRICQTRTNLSEEIIEEHIFRLPLSPRQHGSTYAIASIVPRPDPFQLQRYCKRFDSRVRSCVRWTRLGLLANNQSFISSLI